MAVDARDDRRVARRLADSGVRSGLDVVRMLALGADAVLIGRPYAYALGAAGERGVAHVLDLIASEMRVAMTLTGAKSIADISAHNLVQALPVHPAQP